MAAGDKFEIPVSVNPAGVSPGVDKTVDGLKQIEKQTETTAATAATAGSKFDNSVLMNRRSVSHLLRGLLELQSGGTEALGGLAAEGFVAAEGFEAMLGPLFPLIAAITLAASIGIPMFDRWKEKADKAGGSTNDLDSSTSQWATTLKKAAEDAKDAITSAIQLQEQVDKNFARLEQYGSKVLQGLEETLKLQKENTDEVLRGQEAQELANASGAEAQAAIKQKYAGIRSDTDERADVTAIDVRTNQAYGAQAANEHQRKTLEDRLADEQGKYNALKEQSDKALAVAKAYGIDAGPEGNYADAQKQIGTQYEHQKKGLEGQRAGLAAGGFDENEINEVTHDAAAALADTKKQLDIVRAAAQAVAFFSGKDTEGTKLKEDIDKNTAALQGVVDKINEQNTAIQNLILERGNIILKANTDKFITGQKDKNENRNLADENATGYTQADIDKYQAIVNDKSATPEAREVAEKKIGDLQRQLELAKAQAGLAPGSDKPITAGAAAADRAGGEKDHQEGISKAGEIAGHEDKKKQEAQKPADRAQLESLKREVEQLKKQIEAATNNPEILRGAKMIEASLENDPAKEVPALQTQLALATAAGFKAIDTKVKQNHSELKPKVKKAEKDIADLWGAVRSLSRGMT